MPMNERDVRDLIEEVERELLSLRRELGASGGTLEKDVAAAFRQANVARDSVARVLDIIDHARMMGTVPRG